VEAFNDPGPGVGGNEVQRDDSIEADMWASMERQYNGI